MVRANIPDISHIITTAEGAKAGPKSNGTSHGIITIKTPLPAKKR